MLPVRVSLPNITFLLAILVLVLAIWKRRQLSRLQASDLRQIIIPFVTFSTVVTFTAAINLVRVTADSLVQLLVANELAGAANPESFFFEFGYWGPALIMLQAPARWLGLGYFDTLQSAFVVTLLGSFFYICRSSLLLSGIPRRLGMRITLLSTTLLATTPLVIFQTVYVHNNIVVSTYLLIGVAAFWLALRQQNVAYLYVGILALLGLSLSRTESTLFATIFLACMFSLSHFTRREWLKGVVPYVGLLLGWYVWLLLNVAPQTHILTPTRIGIIAFILGGLLSFVLLWRLTVVRKYLAPRLHLILLGTLCLILAGILVIDSSHLVRMVDVFILNLFTLGSQWWGLTWWMLSAVIIIIPQRAAVRYERLFVVGIFGFVLLLLVISYAHPFRFGWADSANRSFLHILPVFAYYVTLKLTTAIALETGARAEAT